MKKYCRNCGHDITDDDKFCHNCGKRIDEPESAAQSGSRNQNNAYARSMRDKSAKNEIPQENTVRYVQVDAKTGKIAKNVNVNSRSDSMMQGLTIAFVAIAVVLVMVAGSMFISGHMKENITTDGDQTESVIPVSSDTSSSEEPVSSEDEATPVPPELQADYLKGRIKGKWSTKLPYKSMSIPVTFTFDDAENCSCVIKALFITKQFDGNYTVKDGGKCTIKLNGLEEYISQGNSITGDIEFISDDKVNFTISNNIWTLDRLE